MQGLNSCDAFLDLVSKEEITHVIFIDSPSGNNTLKFVTTTTAGFIKMNEVDMEKNTVVVKKQFFVCQSGISVACQLSGQESFALAGKNFDIYIFSFQTGTCINQF